MTHVVLFQIQTAQEKLLRIVETCRNHFSKKERLILFAEDDRALQFVDELLWSTPRESFLPHRIASERCTDLLALTKSKTNWNESKIALNLCPTPLLLEIPCIYDFEDKTTPQKQMLSQMRFEAYKQAQWAIAFH